MLYHIETLFENWLFQPLPSQLLNTLLYSIVIRTNFYTCHAILYQNVKATIFFGVI